MLRGIYTAASGMKNVQVATDTLANNIANVNTTGFKARYTHFQATPEHEMTRLNNNKEVVVGKLITGVELVGTPVHFSQGHLQPTGNPFDLSLDGDGLFAVQLPNGDVGYTRNGNFHLNENNQLVTETNYPVLDTGNAPIVIPSDSRGITVTQDGSISLKTGEQLGTLRRVRFPNPKGLHKLSDSIFQGENPIDLQQGDGARVMQGYLEGSNTNVVHEMIQSISGMRLYEGLQKSISAQNETLQKAVNQIAGK